MNAPFRVPTRTRTPLIPSSFLQFLGMLAQSRVESNRFALFTARSTCRFVQMCTFMRTSAVVKVCSGLHGYRSQDVQLQAFTENDHVVAVGVEVRQDAGNLV